MGRWDCLRKTGKSSMPDKKFNSQLSFKPAEILALADHFQDFHNRNNPVMERVLKKIRRHAAKFEQARPYPFRTDTSQFGMPGDVPGQMLIPETEETHGQEK